MKSGELAQAENNLHLGCLVVCSRVRLLQLIDKHAGVLMWASHKESWLKPIRARLQGELEAERAAGLQGFGVEVLLRWNAVGEKPGLVPRGSRSDPWNYLVLESL